MDNQHQKIKGYRDLSQVEIDLMNEGKALAEKCGEYIAKLKSYPPADKPNETGDPSLDHRWIAIGATDIQKGFMAVIRGIAQPSTF